MYYTRCHEDKFFERLAQNPNLESGLHRIEANPTQDPVVRQLATVVLDECERARRRRQRRQIRAVIGCVIGVFLVIIMLIAFPHASRRH